MNFPQQPQKPPQTQPGAHQQQNWQGYQMRQYNFNPQYLDQYAMWIFQRYDQDRSNSIDINEFPAMIFEFFQCMGLPPPGMNDIYYLMYAFDQDKNGKIDVNEFRAMAARIGGLPPP